MEDKDLIDEIYDQKEDLDFIEKTFFDVAKDEYNSLIDYLSKTIFPSRIDYEMFFENTEFSNKRGFVALDMILQYSLVEIEYKRGQIRDEVVQSIEGVCRYGSLMDEIRKTNPYFNWPDFNLIENNESGEVLKSLKIDISRISRDFASFFNHFKTEDDRKAAINYACEKMNNIINIIIIENKIGIGSPTRLPCLANAIFKQLIK